MYRKAIVSRKALLPVLSDRRIMRASHAQRHGRRRRWITPAFIIILIATSFLFGIGQPGTALAQNENRSQTSTIDQQQATTPLGNVLDEDGTLNLEGNFSGSLDPKGWEMVDEQGKPPRFVPSGSTSYQVQSSLV